MDSFTQKIFLDKSSNDIEKDDYIYKLLVNINGIKETYYLKKGDYNIGRDDDCDIQILKDTISRKHAFIHVEGNGIAFLRDNGSINETYRNGIRLKRDIMYELSSGNDILFGDVHCTYTAELASQGDDNGALSSKICHNSKVGTLENANFSNENSDTLFSDDSINISEDLIEESQEESEIHNDIDFQINNENQFDTTFRHINIDKKVKTSPLDKHNNILNEILPSFSCNKINFNSEKAKINVNMTGKENLINYHHNNNDISEIDSSINIFKCIERQKNDALQCESNSFHDSINNSEDLIEESQDELGSDDDAALQRNNSDHIYINNQVETSTLDKHNNNNSSSKHSNDILPSFSVNKTNMAEKEMLNNYHGNNNNISEIDNSINIFKCIDNQNSNALQNDPNSFPDNLETGNLEDTVILDQTNIVSSQNICGNINNQVETPLLDKHNNNNSSEYLYDDIPSFSGNKTIFNIEKSKINVNMAEAEFLNNYHGNNNNISEIDNSIDIFKCNEIQTNFSLQNDIITGNLEDTVILDQTVIISPSQNNIESSNNKLDNKNVINSLVDYVTTEKSSEFNITDKNEVKNRDSEEHCSIFSPSQIDNNDILKDIDLFDDSKNDNKENIIDLNISKDDNKKVNIINSKIECFVKVSKSDLDDFFKDSKVINNDNNDDDDDCWMNCEFSEEHRDIKDNLDDVKRDSQEKQDTFTISSPSNRDKSIDSSTVFKTPECNRTVLSNNGSRITDIDAYESIVDNNKLYKVEEINSEEFDRNSGEKIIKNEYLIDNQLIDNLKKENNLKFNDIFFSCAKIHNTEERNFIDMLNEETNNNNNYNNNSDETFTQHLSNNDIININNDSQESIYEQNTQKIDELDDNSPFIATQVIQGTNLTQLTQFNDYSTQISTQVIHDIDLVGCGKIDIVEELCTQVVEDVKSAEPLEDVVESTSIRSGSSTVPIVPKSSSKSIEDVSLLQSIGNVSLRVKPKLSLKKPIDQQTQLNYQEKRNEPIKEIKLEIEKHLIVNNNKKKEKKTECKKRGRKRKNQSLLNSNNKENNFNENEDKSEISREKVGKGAPSTSKFRRKLINVEEINGKIFDVDSVTEANGVYNYTESNEADVNVFSSRNLNRVDIDIKRNLLKSETVVKFPKREKNVKNLQERSSRKRDNKQVAISDEINENSKVIKIDLLRTVSEDLDCVMIERTRQDRRSSLRSTSESPLVSNSCQNIIIFSGVVDVKYVNIIRKLGGEITDDISVATHLIMDKMRRTVKFLSCVARGINIVTSDWVVACQRLKYFIPTDSYVLMNGCSKYNFDLRTSLLSARRSQTRCNGILSHYKYVVFVTQNTKPSPSDLEQIISYAGGKFVLISDTQFQEYVNEPNVRQICIASEFDLKDKKQQSHISILIERDIDIVSVEFLFSMILEQKHPEVKKYKLVGS